MIKEDDDSPKIPNVKYWVEKIEEKQKKIEELTLEIGELKGELKAVKKTDVHQDGDVGCADVG